MLRTIGLKRLIPLLSLVFILASCEPPEGDGVRQNRNPQDANPPEEQEQFLTPVIAVEVIRGEITSTVGATASVVPLRSRLITTEEGGRLQFEEDWEEGEFVEEGQVIATLESDALRGEIERAQADLELQRESLDISRKSMESAIGEYEILQGLYSRGIAALKDLDSSELTMQQRINSYRQGQINLQKAESSLQESKNRLQYLTITAPFDGLIVASRTLEGSNAFSTTFGNESITDREGKLISSGYNVCGIIDTSEVYLRADITSKDIDRIEPGQEVLATIYGTNEVQLVGEVAEIARAVDQQTRAFRVDVLVENPDRNLRPGMFARVEIITDRRRDAISIDKDYIVRRNNEDVIFVVDENEETGVAVAKQVPVELGLEGRDEVEITYGLQEGDLIVTRGFEVLQDMTPINVIRGDQTETVTSENLERNGEVSTAASDESTTGTAKNS